MLRTASRPLPLAGLALGLALASSIVACGSPAPAPAPAHAPDPHQALLPNLHRLSEKVISGGAPAGESAFAELAAMGVQTVISVDGAAPDVEAAGAHGLRYVHLPITYAEVSDAERLAIARALRDLPGPIYVHCHHGMHRSPAAVAAAGVALGLVTPEEGVAFMRRAGTAPSYEGLYACVAAAKVASDAELSAAPAAFPAVQRPEGLTGSMVTTDVAWEHLGAIRAAGWKVPADHPDLVPAAEAGILADSLRVGAEAVAAEPAGERRERSDLLERMRAAAGEAAALEQALVEGASPARLEQLYAPVSRSCKSCHARHRDRR